MLAGDYNVAQTDLDIYPTRSWDKDALIQPKSRAAFKALLAQGWTDAVRTLHPAKPMFTFWDYKRNRWPRDAGLRLDHLLLSPALAPRLHQGRRRSRRPRRRRRERPRAGVDRAAVDAARVPGAMQRVLARCFAEPGPIPSTALCAARSAAASLREELRAAPRPGHGIFVHADEKIFCIPYPRPQNLPYSARVLSDEGPLSRGDPSVDRAKAGRTGAPRNGRRPGGRWSAGRRCA